MSANHWKDTLNTYVWIFNVGRGLSIFIRTPLNQGIIYDFGASDDFSPCGFIEDNILPHIDEYKKCKIAQEMISHPHLDHISEIDKLSDSKSPFYATLLTCPHDKDKEGMNNEKINWERITNPEGSEEKIELYKSLYASRTLPLQTIQYESKNSVPNLEYGIYYIRPPKVGEIFEKDDQGYSNGISLIFYFRHGHQTLLIPGDCMPETMEYLLEEKSGTEKRYTIFDKTESSKHPDWNEKTSNQPSLKSNLQKHGLTILIAPHHGLESGYSEALYKSIKGQKPKLVVISEKRHTSESDGKIDNRYQSQDGAEGLNVDIEGKQEKRFSLSTYNGHHILIIFPGTSSIPEVYAAKDPKKLI
jgi:hypothetical protein